MENFESKYIIDELSNKIHHNFQSRNRIKTILNLYAIIGIVLFIFSGLYFAFSFFKYDLTEKQTIMLIFCGVGLSISVMSKMILNLYKEKEKNQIYLKQRISRIKNFMSSWNDFERILNRIVVNEKISDNVFSFKQNIDIMMHKQIISFKDVILLEKALSIRNQIVHGEIQFSYDELDKISLEVEKVTDKLISNYRYFA